MIQWHPAPPILPLSPTPPQPGKCTNMHQHAPTYPPHCGCRCEPLPLIIDIDLLIPTQHSLFASPRDWSCVSLFQIYMMFPQRNQWRTIVSAMWWELGSCWRFFLRHNLWTPQPINEQVWSSWICWMGHCPVNLHVVPMVMQWKRSMTFHDIPGIHDQIIHWVHGSDVFRCCKASTALAFCVQRFTTFVERVTSHIITTVRVDSSSAPVPSSKMETSNHLFRGRKLEKPWTFRCHVAILVYYGNPSILRLIGRWYLWGPWCLIQQLREFLLALCMPWKWTTGLQEQTPTWEMTR